MVMPVPISDRKSPSYQSHVLDDIDRYVAPNVNDVIVDQVSMLEAREKCRRERIVSRGQEMEEDFRVESEAHRNHRTWNTSIDDLDRIPNSSHHVMLLAVVLHVVDDSEAMYHHHDVVNPIVVLHAHVHVHDSMMSICSMWMWMWMWMRMWIPIPSARISVSMM